jgi:hypothetical protein
MVEGVLGTKRERSRGAQRVDRYTEIEEQWGYVVVAGFPSDTGFWLGVCGSPFRGRVFRDIDGQIMGRVEVWTHSRGANAVIP